jgi:hypothetical protein
LGEQLKYHNKVMLDAPPYNSEYLDDILRAIDKHYLLKFKYVSAFGAESDMMLKPAFVIYFKHWSKGISGRNRQEKAYPVSSFRPHQFLGGYL